MSSFSKLKKRITVKPKGYSTVSEIASELGLKYSTASKLARSLYKKGEALRVSCLIHHDNGVGVYTSFYKLK